MHTIPAESEAQLSGLLDRIERGETVIITRGGKAVARLVPETSPDPRQVDVGRVLAEIDSFRKTMPRLTVDEILTSVHEGHDR